MSKTSMSKTVNSKSPVHPVRFVLNDQAITHLPERAELNLLDYLRDEQGLTGTKEGCAEGDCGACTVMMGSLQSDGTIAYEAINSCIRFLPSVHGKQIVTVEHLSKAGQALHPAQAAMKACHATQCGFCTPGFVMSLAAHYEHSTSSQSTNDQAEAGLTDTQARTLLSGNLCRCTGYRPILEAACSMHDRVKFPPQRAEQKTWSSPAAVEALYEAMAAPPVEIPGQWTAPRDDKVFAQSYVENPRQTLVAGMTDVGIWTNKQHKKIAPVLYLGDVAQFKQIDESADQLVVHAAVSHSEAWKAICKHYPELTNYGERFASVPVRNSATFVGNIANGSPIGDSMPLLLALGATLILQRSESQRELPLDSFYLTYRRTTIRPAEFIRAVRVPLLALWHVRAYKLSKRFDQDISACALGIALRLDSKGVIAAVRLGVGGMAAIPMRARSTEAFLLGKPWTNQTVSNAAQVLLGEFTPLDDMRASAAYRSQALANLLVRDFYLSNPQTSLGAQNLESL